MEDESHYLPSLDVENSNIEQLRGRFDKAIVVLQGGIEEGYKDDAKIPYFARLRMHAGTRVYQQALDNGESPVLILSGGARININGRYITEGESMKKLLVKHYGVDEERIILEENSIDTISNAQQTAKILEMLDPQTTLLITSDFHLERSYRAFEKYCKRSCIPISAEKTLIAYGESLSLEGDSFSRFSKLFLVSKKNKFLRGKDRVIEGVSNLPGGRELLKFIAERSRK